MELQGYGAQSADLQAERDGHPKVRLQLRVVEGCVNPLRPRLVEGKLALNAVHRVERRRQSRFQRTLVQERGGKAVQRLDCRLVKLLDSLPIALTDFIGLRAVICGSFELCADAVAQFGGGGLGEGDRRNPVERGRATAYEVEDAVNKACGLAGARARFHEECLVQRGCYALSLFVVSWFKH